MKIKIHLFKLLVFLIFLVSFLFFSKTEVFAKNACRDKIYCDHSGEFCKTRGFDCSKEDTTLGETECHEKGGCFESECGKTYCYLVLGEKLPPNSISCPDGEPGVNTALGCVPTNDLNSFIAWLLKNMIIIAGGIAFILLAIGIFQITTSAGDPKKVQAGSELITSTLSGLLFIILSLFLLKLIGVDILHLPGF